MEGSQRIYGAGVEGLNAIKDTFAKDLHRKVSQPGCQQFGIVSEACLLRETSVQKQPLLYLDTPTGEDSGFGSLVWYVASAHQGRLCSRLLGIVLYLKFSH